MGSGIHWRYNLEKNLLFQSELFHGFHGCEVYFSEDIGFIISPSNNPPFHSITANQLSSSLARRQFIGEAPTNIHKINCPKFSLFVRVFLFHKNSQNQNRSTWINYLALTLRRLYILESSSEPAPHAPPQEPRGHHCPKYWVINVFLSLGCHVWLSLHLSFGHHSSILP